MKKLLVALVLLFFSIAVRADGGIPESILRLPTVVELENGGKALGFYLEVRSNLYFVTARRVIFVKGELPNQFTLRTGSAVLRSYLTGGDGGAGEVLGEVNWRVAMAKGSLFTLSDHDVAVLKLGALSRDGMAAPSTYITYRQTITKPLPKAEANALKHYNEITVGNPAYIFSYPISLSGTDPAEGGLFEADSPLPRSGMIAAKDTRKQRFAIDCPTASGNIGSPVIEQEPSWKENTNRFYIVGVVAESVPLSSDKAGKSNSGYAIAEPLDLVLDLIDSFER